MNDEERLRELETRIARGEKIEPGDWIPDNYRSARTLEVLCSPPFGMMIGFRWKT